MNNFKIFLCVIFLVVGLSAANAQTYKFLTTGFSVLEKNERGSWGKWSEFEDASIAITLDTKKDRIVVYSQEIQLYKIVQYQDEIENENDHTYPFSCVDEDGTPVVITIITRKNQNNRKQLYITRSNFIVVYNIINFPDPAPKR